MFLQCLLCFKDIVASTSNPVFFHHGITFWPLLTDQPLPGSGGTLFSPIYCESLIAVLLFKLSCNFPRIYYLRIARKVFFLSQPFLFLRFIWFTVPIPDRQKKNHSFCIVSCNLTGQLCLCHWLIEIGFKLIFMVP